MTKREAYEHAAQAMARDAKVCAAWAAANTVWAAFAMANEAWIAGWMGVVAAAFSAFVASGCIYLHSRCSALLADMGEDET